MSTVAVASSVTVAAFSAGRKPRRLAFTEYSPGGTAGTRKDPSIFVTVTRVP